MKNMCNTGKFNWQNFFLFIREIDYITINKNYKTYKDNNIAHVYNIYYKDIMLYNIIL